MDKFRRKQLKKGYLEASRKNDFAFQCWEARKAQIRQVREINEESIEGWADNELERKIVDYVLNQFNQAGKPSRQMNINEWERDILVQLPIGVQAVFATNLFEGSLALNTSFLDFFYGTAGAFALETLNGYKLMNNLTMAQCVEQGMGAYLKLRNAGEVKVNMGEIHQWAVDENHYISTNSQSFEELDAESHGDKRCISEALRVRKQSFIRKNPGLFVTKK